MSTEGGTEQQKKTIHQFTVSRCATTFDPLEVIAGASRQAQAEQVVGGFAASVDDKDALSYYYEDDHCGPEVYVDLIVWGTDEELVHAAARALHNRYEGHAEPQEIIEELEVKA